MQTDNSASTTDLTERRIASKWKVVIKELEGLYQRLPAVKATFFDAWDAAELALTEKLRRRPLALADMEALFAQFRAQMLKAL